MQITVTGRHLKITPEIRSYAEERVSKMTRILDRLLSARVTLELEGDLHCAEASVHGPRGAVLVASGRAPDPYKALDEMEGRLEQQVRKLKTRMENGHTTPQPH